MKRKCVVGAFVLALTVALLAGVSTATETPKSEPAVFKVPTTGKIIDVTYVPEFDDWWVKCREGDSIVVYSYDRQREKWGKVTFTPDKAAAAAMKQQRAKPKPPPESAPETKSAPPTEGIKAPSAPEKKIEPAPVPKKSSQHKEKKSSHRKWWDPLGIIKIK